MRTIALTDLTFGRWRCRRATVAAILGAIFSFERCEREDLLRIFALASVIKEIERRLTANPLFCIHRKKKVVLKLAHVKWPSDRNKFQKSISRVEILLHDEIQNFVLWVTSPVTYVIKLVRVSSITHSNSHVTETLHRI